MTSLQGDSSSREALREPFREPLLWIQLLGLAAWPLEALGLLLLLAGGDPGPFPFVERLFCWGLGALLPAVLFWRLPPDPWSLLLLQVPLRGRRERQLRLSALLGSFGLRLVAATGALPLLALVWWDDRLGGIAWSLSPLAATPRLVVLLTCTPLLALMLWQWQQLVQAIWLLSRPLALLETTQPLVLEQAREQRLNLGLPLLLLPDLSRPEPIPAAQPTPVPDPEPEATPVQAPEHPDPSRSDEPLIQSEPAADTDQSAQISATGILAAAVPMAIEEQQAPEDGKGADLDPQV